jgi:type VI secretion system protein ImpM
MDAPAGWFGKLPCCGDFLARRLDAQLVGILDGWLSRSMRVSRERRGDEWLRSYLAARVVCFAWTPGVVDDQWWRGVLMPSCDNVGRYFPLIVLQALTRSPCEAGERTGLLAWHARHGAAALRVLDDDVSLDDFERYLRIAACPEAAEPGADPGMEGPAWWRALQDDAAGRSAWWPHDTAGAAVVVHAGLPDPAAFMSLLGGGPQDAITSA